MKQGLLTLVLFVLSTVVFATDYIIYKDIDQFDNVGKKISILKDTTQLSIEEVLQSDGFELSSSDVVPLGVSTDSYWLKVPIENRSNRNNLILDIDFPILDEICFYSKNKDGSYNEICAGELYPFESRGNNSTSFVFDLNLKPGEKEVYYLEVKSGEQMNIPVVVSSKDAFYNIVERDILSGLYFGIILVMFFYNLFIYYTTKDKAYFYYVGYIFLVGIVQFTLHGYSFKYLWPNSSFLAIHSIYIINALTAIASILFFQHFINAAELIPKVNKGFWVFVFLYSAEVILAFAGMYNEAYNLMNMAAMLLSLYLIFASVVAIKKKSRTAKFFLIGWMFFLTSIIMFVLKDIGVLSYNLFTSHVLQVGSGLEVIMLSFGLADRINTLKEEKEFSQRKALEASMENERLVKEQNITLERKVNERTAELKSTNEDLNLAMKALKNTQSKLVDQEKMASLGQLTAGIAHEINNPINFVSSNVRPLKRDIQDVFEIFDKYDEIKTPSDFEGIKEEIEELKEEIELEVIREEIDSLLQGIEDGANRTAEIVKGLKVFSRMDEQDLKRVDLAEGIESTLTLLNSSLRDVKIKKDFGKIARVECYAGKLNQVFMNIINNAIHAIEEKGMDEGEAELSIGIKDADSNVILSFEDNGIGIDEEFVKKIYDPFYTTKEVGSGTGLGLSITLGIIDKHNGSIECKSEKGVGTKFIITLPKTQSTNQPN